MGELQHRLVVKIDDATKGRLLAARERWRVRARADEQPPEATVVRGLLRYALGIDEECEGAAE